MLWLVMHQILIPAIMCMSDINSNRWDKLPPLGQFKSTVQIIDTKLMILGGHNITKSNEQSGYI